MVTFSLLSGTKGSQNCDFIKLAALLTEGMKVFAQTPPFVSFDLHLNLTLHISTSGLAFLSLLSRNLHKFPCSQMTSALPPVAAQKSREELFPEQLGCSPSSLPSTGTVPLLHSQFGISRVPGWSPQSPSCSPRLPSLALGYKKLGMDVCQEVVNKLGTLFFLWLSLPSLVCLCRSCRADFWDPKPGSFLGGRQGGAVMNPALQRASRSLPGLCIQATDSK